MILIVCFYKKIVVDNHMLNNYVNISSVFFKSAKYFQITFNQINVIKILTNSVI